LIIISCSTFAGLFGPKYVHNLFVDGATICDANDPSYKDWVSNFDSTEMSITELYLYDVLNPSDYMTGGVAEIDEVGPFSFDCRDKKFDVMFAGATVEYKSYKKCEFVDTLSCDKCLFEKQITNLSPAYGSILTQTVNEGVLLLKAAGCSQEQIANIGGLSTLANKPCNWLSDSGGLDGDTTCGCCIPNQPNVPGSAAASANVWRDGENCMDPTKMAVGTFEVEKQYGTCALMANPAGGPPVCGAYSDAGT